MSFPVKDTEFFSRIPGEIGRFPGDQTRVLMDHNATRDNIDLAITEWLVDNVPFDAVMQSNSNIIIDDVFAN